MTPIPMWEMLLPSHDNNGQPFPQELFNEFEKFVVTNAGGYTFINTRNKTGVYKMEDGTFARDELFRIHIAAFGDWIEQIAAFAANLFSQESVMVFKVSEDVRFVKASS